MAVVTELNCPYCGKSVSIEEYERALEKVRLKLEKESRDQVEKLMEHQRKEKESFENQIRMIQENHQVLINQIKKEVHDETRSMYEQDIENMKRKFVELDMQRQDECAKLEEELYKKDRQIENELQRSMDQAREEARNAIQNEIEAEKDKIKQMEIQIRRAQEEAEKLKRQLSETQSELKGEIGELDLLDKLKNAFPDDLLERSSRGTESGDIIHKIKLKSGTLLDTVIVYDYKNANVVSLKDIEKAKKYKQIHGTEYVIIVSQNLPKKEIKNGRIGVKEGVSVIHPSIIVDVVKVIRKGIIDISKLSMSKKEQDIKQSILYDYIQSREFCSLMEEICHIYELNVKLQDDDEKNHRTLWNKRKAVNERLKNACISMSSGIDSIMQESYLQTPLDNIT